jgi:hypothetical protein
MGFVEDSMGADWMIVLGCMRVVGSAISDEGEG